MKIERVAALASMFVGATFIALTALERSRPLRATVESKRNRVSRNLVFAGLAAAPSNRRIESLARGAVAGPARASPSQAAALKPRVNARGSGRPEFAVGLGQPGEPSSLLS